MELALKWVLFVGINQRANETNKQKSDDNKNVKKKKTNNRLHIHTRLMGKGQLKIVLKSIANLCSRRILFVTLPLTVFERA